MGDNLFPEPKGSSSAVTLGGISGGIGGDRGGNGTRRGSGSRYEKTGGEEDEEGDDDVGAERDDDGTGLRLASGQGLAHIAPGPGLGSPVPVLQDHQVQLVDEVQRRWEAERERREQMEKVAHPHPPPPHTHPPPPHTHTLFLILSHDTFYLPLY